MVFYNIINKPILEIDNEYWFSMINKIMILINITVFEAFIQSSCTLFYKLQNEPPMQIMPQKRNHKK